MRLFLSTLGLLVASLVNPLFAQPTLTDEIYRASKSPEVNALCKIADINEREDAAAALDAKGVVIDRPIDIWCWDPVLVMVYRAQLGVPWAPNAFQPNLVDPFQTGVTGGQPATDLTRPWDRSIKVSIDAKDYPAFEPPPPPVPVNVRPVGAYIGNGLFSANYTAITKDGKFLFKEGDVFVQDGTRYVFHKVNTPFGPSVNWTQLN